MLMFNRFVGAYTGTQLDHVSDSLTYSNNSVWGGRGGFPKNLVTHVSLKKLIKYLLTIILIVNSQTAFAKTPTTVYKQFAFMELNHSFEQFYCLDKLYFHESRWNPKASNGSHHGIPQGKSEWLKGVSGTTQVLWGIKYIKSRYGVDKAGVANACAALNHWSKKGWH